MLYELFCDDVDDYNQVQEQNVTKISPDVNQIHEFGNRVEGWPDIVPPAKSLAEAAADATPVAAGVKTGLAVAEETADSAAPAGVAEWLAGRGVLLTGATGFLGQLLMEKMLRSCPDVGAIYLLVRDKRGDPPERRLDRLLEDPLFDRVRDRRDRLVLVRGDCAAKDLGLSESDRALLLRSVSVILHCAATVRFDSPLRTAAHINVRATGEILRLAKEMPQLQSLVHLSTAYAHCPQNRIEERVYAPRMRAEQLLSIVEALDDDALDRITPVLMDEWPNTYCFTKAIAEDLVMRESKGLPVCVLRPSMVVGTNKEPLRGWINNINGPAGLMMGVGIGILHSIHLKNQETVLDIVPGDLVINAVLAAARVTANKECRPPVTTDSDSGGDIPVYNCVSSPRNPISFNTLFNLNVQYGRNYPSEHCLWYYCVFITSSRLVHNIHRIFLHLLPALIVDTFLRVAGRKPMLWGAYKKIHKFLDLTDYFGNNEWVFTDTNLHWLCKQMTPEDKKNFPCDIDDLDWDDMLQHMISGLRQYFLKDPLSTVEKAKIKYNRLKVMHYILVGALWLLFLQMVWWILSFIW